jgi:hypothetical protein
MQLTEYAGRVQQVFAIVDSYLYNRQVGGGCLQMMQLLDCIINPAVDHGL